MINLGMQVKDTITGFAGVATAVSTYLNGCVRFLIEPPLDKDGKFVEGQWIDEQRVKPIGTKIEFVPEPSAATAGGPQETPRRASDAPR